MSTCNYCHICNEPTNNAWVCETCASHGWVYANVHWMTTDIRTQPDDPIAPDLISDLRLAVLRAQYLATPKSKRCRVKVKVRLTS